MRRAHIGNEVGYQPTNQMLEEDNLQLEDQLSGKVHALKELTINIGTEVREHNKFLKDMDDDFDASGNILQSTMGRLKQIARQGGHKFIFYVLMFALFVFFVCWMIIRFR